MSGVNQWTRNNIPSWIAWTDPEVFLLSFRWGMILSLSFTFFGGPFIIKAMNWNDFCNFWIQLGKDIQNWFVQSDTTGLNPISRIIIALCVLILGRFLVKLFIRILRKIFGINNKLAVDVSVKTFSLSITNVILNLGLAVLVLVILDVDLTSLSSILSAGTVAIGLSLQDLISAFASGVVLLKSRYFKTGDYIQVVHAFGTCEGTVSSVGLIATTMETYDNQHVVIPNNKLLQGVITNYTLNPTRRAVMTIQVHVDTDIAQARTLILDAISKDDRVLVDPKPSVVVDTIDEYSIFLSIRCYAKNRDYWDVYFGVREAVLLTMKQNGIRFPEKRLKMAEK